MQIRCPHCHNPIEVVNDDPSGDVSCPSCGSCFNLAKDIETIPDPETGSRMLGHFQLLHCLGQGAFGAVWKAKDTKLDRIVALKIPRKEQLREGDAEKFLREARAAAQVRHPNIVAVHEVGREDGRIYIASDFIDGPTLADWIETHPLTTRDAAELCATVAEALHHAHEVGIVHRDLKPQNILVKTEGQGLRGEGKAGTVAGSALTSQLSALSPFITDFGLAKREAGEITMTVEGAILGTPAYMPPEQARGEAHQADRRSDVYSLGVILFRLLTGELPFRGKSQMLIVQILNEEPPTLRKLDARIPRDLETICLKCLEKDPARRYTSSAELASDLRRWLTGHPITARPVSRTERAWRWCKRNSTVAALSATVAHVLLIGIAVSLFFAFESSNRAKELAKKQDDLVEETKRADARADEAKENDKAARRNLYSAHMNQVQSEWEKGHAFLVSKLLDRWQFTDDYKNNGNEASLGVESAAINETIETLQSLQSGPMSTRPSDGRSVAGGQIPERAEPAPFDGFPPPPPPAETEYQKQMANHFRVDDDRRNFEWFYWNRLLEHTRLMNPNLFRTPTGSANGTAPSLLAIQLQDALRLQPQVGRASWVVFNPSGTQLLTAGLDKTVKLWDATTGKELRVMTGNSAEFQSAVFSPDGKYVASASTDGQIVLWDMASGNEKLTIKGHMESANQIAFSPDNTRIASGAIDGTVNLWDTASGEKIATYGGHLGRVTTVAFNRDGRFVASGSADETVKLWDVATGKEAITLKGTQDQGEVTSVAFTKDGKLLASARGRNEPYINIWDASSYREILVLIGHTARIRHVQFSPDGERLASASDDGTVRLWDTTTGQVVLTLENRVDVTSIAFDADGKRLASADTVGRVKLWDARPWTPELRAEWDALDLIHRLQQTNPQEEWLAAIDADRTVNAVVRRLAIELAQAWKSDPIHDAAIYGQRAHSFAEQRLWDSALKEFELATSSPEADSALIFFHGIAAMASHDRDRTQNVQNRLLERFRSSGNRNVADAENVLWLTALIQNHDSIIEDLARLTDIATKAAAANPSVALFYRVQSLVQAKQYAEAIQVAKDAADAKPPTPLLIDTKLALALAEYHHGLTGDAKQRLADVTREIETHYSPVVPVERRNYRWFNCIYAYTHLNAVRKRIEPNLEPLPFPPLPEK